MGYDPWQDAARRHDDVIIRRTNCLPARGAWVESARVILIDKTLRRAERNSVLAHEIAHIDLEHRMTGRRWFDRRQERDADHLAARRLVTIDELADVLRWALCPEEVAHELDVTVDVVRRRIASLSDQEKTYIERAVRGSAPTEKTA
jgi:Zn-dependent peptidase ImmA (M78 family)